MAENLPEDVSITVLTNSVTVAEVLRKKMNVSVILLGGAMSHRGHCHDYYTIQMVDVLVLDVLRRPPGDRQIVGLHFLDIDRIVRQIG